MLKKLKLKCPIRPFRAKTHTHTQDFLFFIGNWNAKVGSQDVSGVTGKVGHWVQNEAGQRVLSREHTGHSKHPFPSTQEITLHIDITRWSPCSHVWLCGTPWTVSHQVPLSMEFSRQEYWSGWPFPSLGGLPDPAIEPRSSTLQADSLPAEPPKNPGI